MTPRVVSALRTVALGALLLPAAALAEGVSDAGAASTLVDLGTDSKWLKTFSIEPRVLQADDPGSNASIGLGYKIFSRPLSWDWAGDAQPGQPLPKLAENIASLEFSAKGLYSSKVEANPEKVVDATAAGAWRYGFYDSNFAFKTTFGGGYSEEQGNSKSDWRLEAAQTIGTVLSRLNDTFLIGRGAYARVDPIKDKVRKAALTTDPEPYNRFELELLAIVPVNIESLRKVELRFLGFREPGAPDPVKAAGLDQSKLWSVYFALPNKLFIAFSKGGVPADRQDAKILQIGWSSSEF